MEDTITLTQKEHDCLIQLFSAVLDWKAARLALQMLQNQGEPEEKIAQAQYDLVVCERALSDGASSKVGRQLFLASQGCIPTVARKRPNTALHRTPPVPLLC